MSYAPRPDLATWLVNASPSVGSAAFDMVTYWQKTHAGGSQTPEEGWESISMTPAHAREAIALRIVPEEIYELAAARAAEDET